MKKLLPFFLFVASACAVVPPTTQRTVTVDANGNLLPVTVNGHAINLPAGSTVGGAAINSGTSGSVSIVSVTTANGISGTVSNATTTPAITLSLGAITPVSINGLSISGSGSLTSTGGFVSNTNTGDQTSVTGNAGTATKLATARTISITGPVTWSVNFDGSAIATGTGTLSTVNSNVGTFTNATITVGADGRITAASTGSGGGGSGSWGGITGTLGDQTDLVAALAAKQGLDSDLTYLASFTPTTDVKSLLNAATFAGMRTAMGLTIGTNVQAFDSDLSLYATVTPQANTLTFLGSADFAAMRTALSLTIGTNVQAFDSDLNYLSTFTPTANVKSILNAANYAAIETLMGHGNIVTQNGTGTSVAPQVGNGTGGFSPMDSSQYFTFSDPGNDFVPWYRTAANGAGWFQAAFDRDTTLAADDPDTIPSQEAVKTYVDGMLSDTAYNATSWDGDTTHAPTKNAVRDEIQALTISGGGGTVTQVTTGNAAPYFTATVDTNTTTPAIVYAVSAIAAHSTLSNTTGGSLAPAAVTNTALKADMGLSASDKPIFANVFYGTSTLTWASTTAIDFSGDAMKTVTLAGNTTFSTSNLAAGRTKIIRIVCDSTGRTLAFPTSPNWTFITATPASIAATKTAILTLTSFSTTNADVVAAYQVQP